MLGIKRRQFITLLGGAAAWPLAATAQQPDRIGRIGALMPYDENDPVTKTIALVLAVPPSIRVRATEVIE